MCYLLLGEMHKSLASVTFLVYLKTDVLTASWVFSLAYRTDKSNNSWRDLIGVTRTSFCSVSCSSFSSLLLVFLLFSKNKVLHVSCFVCGVYLLCKGYSK